MGDKALSPLEASQKLGHEGPFITDDPTRANLVRLAALTRRAVSHPAYADEIEAHTSGMAELISHATGEPYCEVRRLIVDASFVPVEDAAEDYEELQAIEDATLRRREGSCYPLDR